jgi:uncharacterized protein (DUF952 family)
MLNSPRAKRPTTDRLKDLQHSILHICSSAAWAAAKNGEYRCPSLDTEGFIHCCTTDQVVEVANYLFRGQRGLVLLVIDPESLIPNIRYEDAGNGMFFPHIYGPLNVNAVVGVKAFEPTDSGTFELPARLA